ncbi:MAG TPA: hypothetical protein VGO62_18795 [Myxococcota bacterium]
MRQLRGYSLNLVMMLSVMLVVSLTTMLVVLSRSAQLSGELLSRKETFFATDGMMRSVLKVANDYLASNPGASSLELNTNALTVAVQDSITPAGYSREQFQVTLGNQVQGPVPNGAFAGMNATLYPINTSIRLRKSLYSAASQQTVSSTIAQIAMFEFMVFVDGYGDWEPGANQSVNGRVHANGNMCLQAGANFCLSRVTSAGGIYNMRDTTNCRENHTGGGAVMISKTATPTFATCTGTTNADWGLLDTTPTNRESGCTNCSGVAGAVWAAWAQTEFAGNALDSRMGVSRLQLPIAGTPQVQNGSDANKQRVNNAINERLLVDPVRAADTANILAQKYAAKADIRIIDGVWYLADPAAASWPGTPIWSDHPGTYSITNAGSPDEFSIVGARLVGQDDISAAMTARGTPWTVGSPPRLFSYYETNAAHTMMETAAATAKGVISYGGLILTSAARWQPGHWTNAGGDADLCPPGKSMTGASSGFRSALDTTGVCSGVALPPEVGLLIAARTGFRDGHVEAQVNGFTGANVNQAKILPTNFDVSAFRAALASTAAGELGSYFCSGGGSCLMHRRFNGIVWISSTWTGALSNFNSGTLYASLAPVQGALSNSATQPGVRGASGVAGGSDNLTVQSALPYPLCTGGAALPATTSSVKPFFFPNCADFVGGGGARPNAIRLVNADVVGLDYDADGADDGLSIVSNLPVYVQGEWNTKNAAGTAINTSTQTSTPWVPAMVGGDQLYMLSDAWTDQNEPWDIPINQARAVGANNTVYNVEVLAGWSESAGGQYSGGVENFPRYLENLGGKTNTITGSLVVGFNSVYFRWPRAGGPYSAPNRVWTFDLHLNAIANQPPGTPTYNVYATRQWARN